MDAIRLARDRRRWLSWERPCEWCKTSEIDSPILRLQQPGEDWSRFRWLRDDLQLFSRQHRQLLAKDLGVVADIDRQRVQDKKSRISAVCGCCVAELPQLFQQGSLLGFRLRPLLGPRLGEDHRPLLAGRADADEGRAIDPRMLVEDGFAGNREQRAGRGDDAVRLAAAEPERCTSPDRPRSPLRDSRRRPSGARTCSPSSNLVQRRCSRCG